MDMESLRQQILKAIGYSEPQQQQPLMPSRSPMTPPNWPVPPSGGTGGQYPNNVQFPQAPQPPTNPMPAPPQMPNQAMMPKNFQPFPQPTTGPMMVGNLGGRAPSRAINPHRPLMEYNNFD